MLSRYKKIVHLSVQSKTARCFDKNFIQILLVVKICSHQSDEIAIIWISALSAVTLAYPPLAESECRTGGRLVSPAAGEKKEAYCGGKQTVVNCSCKLARLICD